MRKDRTADGSRSKKSVGIGVVVKKGSVRVDLAVCTDEIRTCHCRTCGRACAVRSVSCSRHIVSHIVTQHITSEAIVQANVVEQVLAGELCGGVVRHIRIADVGVILPSLLVECRTGAIYTIAIGVIDRLPEIFIDSSGIVNLPYLVGTDGVPASACLETDFVLPLSPLLVVTRMTPLAPRDP